MRSFIMLLFMMFSLSSFSFGEIIFMDNFDDHPDWSPVQKTGGQTNITSNSNDIAPPEGYDYYTMDGSAYSNKGNNTMNINSFQARGNEGKSFTFWTEKDHACGAWCNDGLLGIQLPGGEKGYNEIYIRFYIKFQKNWKWGNVTDSGIKILHVAHSKLGDSKNSFFSTTQNKPRAFFKIYKMKNSNSADGLSDVAGNPTVSRYNGGSSNPNYIEPVGYFLGGSWNGNGIDMGSTNSEYKSALINKYGSAANVVYSINNDEINEKCIAENFSHGMFGDGEWHCWEWRLKMNSAEGVADGVFAFWQDGVPVYEMSDIDWCMNGGGNPSNRQWNYIWLGGNNNNLYSTINDEGEQWYSVDDLIVSTTYVGPMATMGNLIIK